VANPSNSAGSVVVKPVAPEVVDVFWGTGWGNWSRLNVTAPYNMKHLVHVAGINPPFSIRLQVSAILREEVANA
jgi:hypothetical protein